MFHMWSALALELLGKSSLASIHPTLVAEPTHTKSILAACGKAADDGLRSISGKQTYERLGFLTKEFDERTRKNCSLMADRRNAELHSGVSPTTRLRPEAWVPDFWRAASVILRIQDRSLEDWTGPQEAERVDRILADRTQVLVESVRARIARCKAEFNKRLPAQDFSRKLFIDQINKTVLTVDAVAKQGLHDGSSRVECPACGCLGWLFGTELDVAPGDLDYDGGMPFMYATVTYGSEAFLCGACGLRLDGQEELRIGEVAEEFEREEERDVEYDDPYQDE
ncbi:MAG: hypothetical protein RMA76_44330 [Deltaproteobacteria bacterium]|jgi:hypothetical protein